MVLVKRFYCLTYFGCTCLITLSRDCGAIWRCHTHGTSHGGSLICGVDTPVDTPVVRTYPRPCGVIMAVLVKDLAHSRYFDGP